MNESYEFPFSNFIIYLRNLNETYEYLDYLEDYLEDEPEVVTYNTTVEDILCIFIAVAGIVGNLIVCLAILLDRKLHTVTNYFLLSLVVNDQLICLFGMPVRYLHLRTRYVLQPSAFPLCILMVAGDNLLNTASNVHICAISIERYFAIKNPFNPRNKTKKRLALKITSVWTVALLSIIPFLTFVIITGPVDLPMTCSNWISLIELIEAVIIRLSVFAFNILLELLSFILTAIVLFRLIKKQKENISNGLVRTVGGQRTNGETNNQEALQNLETEKKALIVVFVMCCTSIICLFPIAFVVASFVFFPEIRPPIFFLYAASFANILGPAIHPIIYTVFNNDFRKAIKNIILFKWKQS